MNTTRWSNRYKLGVPEIDAQHQRWFVLTEAFMQLARNRQADREVIEAALVDAADYAKEHFANEEALMRKVRYPVSEYRRHCDIHLKFRTHVESITEKWVAGQTVEATEIASFMSQWLIGHILSTDIKYIGFCLSTESELEQRGNRKRRTR